MKMKDYVYMFISTEYYTKKRTEFTQKEIADTLDLSLSTVNNAIKPLVRMHAIKVRRRGFDLRDFEKLMVYWATVRNIDRDIVYSTFCPSEPLKIEGSLPSCVLFTGYSGYRILFDIAPADYSEIYVYSDDRCMKEIQNRFPKRKGPSNLFVFRCDERLNSFKTNGCVPLPLIFVDVWNLPEWYAIDFLKEIRKKLFQG